MTADRAGRARKRQPQPHRGRRLPRQGDHRPLLTQPADTHQPPRLTTSEDTRSQP
jgi:hypothetical protein